MRLAAWTTGRKSLDPNRFDPIIVPAIQHNPVPSPSHSARDSPALFDQGIALFNRCEFYDCHEVLEEVWTPTLQPERWFLQSLIHFAVGFYHHQRGNDKGAARQLRKGLHKIAAYLPEWGGVRTAEIEQQARRCLEIIERGGQIETFPRIERCGAYSGRDYLAERAAKAASRNRIL